MRPQGVVGALVAIAVGAILTYAVTFTVSGISIHTVGVIIMLAGVAALAILLVRAASASRRRNESLQAPITQSSSRTQATGRTPSAAPRRSG
jgi:high-affinity Fe2+/Pb2+ permease